jgi:23S rRNA pseudouridine1911/1915/1917 synthase
VTHYAVEREFRISNSEFSLATKLVCRLDTGRTHQIRVHMRHIGCPLIGDPVYGRKAVRLSTKPTLNFGKNGYIVSEKETVSFRFSLSRQALHACRLRLVHPATGKLMECKASLPEDLETLEKHLRSLTF